MPSSYSVRRAITFAFVLSSALAAFATSASAAPRVFVGISTTTAQIWEINPVTGQQISGFVAAPNPATRPGLAFNGTELFYTDENLTQVRVFSTTGTLLRSLNKPAGSEPGSGLGVSATTLFMASLDGVITRINPVTGAVQGTFAVTGGQHGLTFAGSRNSIFEVVNDSATIRELSTTGALINTITVTPAEIFRGLGFSSSANVLYGTRAGKLWAVNPNTGAMLAGYPVDITDTAGAGVFKSGAAAADEATSCGDGQVNNPGETCDPPLSQLPNGNTCRQDCTYCGDGTLQTPEICDNGAANSDTTPGACRTDCSLPVCGDGVTDPGEACDDGNAVNTDACRNDCTLPTCGDGIQDPGEQCDDGNAINTDACRNNCTFPFCGDGIQDPGEQCDDGNSNDEDGCSSLCVPELCGDGVIQPGLGEQCDPPNVGDCTADCHLPEVCTDFIDNDGDGFVDCFDPECECGPIGRDPGAIRFGGPGKGDLLSIHGAFIPSPPTAADPANEVVGLRLSNDDGTIYQIQIAPGTLKKIGRNLYRFKDRFAQRSRSGLARVDVRFFPRRNNWTFLIKTYGDLAAAKDPTKSKMGAQWVVGDDPFLNVSVWEKTSSGWLLTLP